MPTVIRNTPSGLIPQELFKEEKIQEYWNVLYPEQQQVNIGTDDLKEFFLLYPKPKDTDTVHVISLMYNNLREKHPKQTEAICLEIADNNFNLLVLQNIEIVFAGYFLFSVKEDIVYHLANVSQQFFDDISQIIFYYNSLTPKMLSFLNEYFEMKQL
ncbi:MAG: DUF3822 family protein [Lentimicrobiaceae bacterium]|nr:DUF3822 family protein [Lentimicrobiaceae bacterium]